MENSKAKTIVSVYIEIVIQTAAEQLSYKLIANCLRL